MGPFGSDRNLGTGDTAKLSTVGVVEATWDRDTRIVEVNLQTGPGTELAAVPRARRASHSGYSAPWRARV